MVDSSIRLILIAVCAVLSSGCGSSWRSQTADAYFQTRAVTDHRKPKTTSERGVWWDETLHSTVRPLGKVVSPATYIGFALGGPSALDVNRFGQVPDSSWFTNRITRGNATIEMIRDGRRPGSRPAEGTFEIISGKLEGVSPGFVVRDSADVVWFVKFDTPAYPELTTGAELIASRILHAAGFNVPENHIVDLDVRSLTLSESAKTRDHYDRSIPLRRQDLSRLLLQLNPDSSSRLRALFSRAVPGEPIGPFRYRGRRADDPNDNIVHERRRSLRGLRFFYAWLNNTDGRYHNTLSTFIRNSDGLGHVRHYLLDFGDSLGAANGEEKSTQNGYERRLDWREIGLRIGTLGVRDPLWFRVGRSAIREVGVFESDVFEPMTWTPRYNNPAFQAADAGDLRWAASIMAHFGEAEIRAAVEAAQFGSSLASKWIEKVLVERRNKLLRSAFSRSSSLEMPRVVSGVITLTDLIVLAELPDAPPENYVWKIRWNRRSSRDRHITTRTTREPSLELLPILTKASEEWGSFSGDQALTIAVRRDDRDQYAEIDVVVRSGEVFAVSMRH